MSEPQAFPFVYCAERFRVVVRTGTVVVEHWETCDSCGAGRWVVPALADIDPHIQTWVTLAVLTVLGRGPQV